jgi:hypothetical protein
MQPVKNQMQRVKNSDMVASNLLQETTVQRHVLSQICGYKWMGQDPVCQLRTKLVEHNRYSSTQIVGLHNSYN